MGKIPAKLQETKKKTEDTTKIVATWCKIVK